MCEHETCPYCHRIVTPLVTNSRLFTTKICPLCRNVISDVANVESFRRKIILTQEEQYLNKAFEAESRGHVDLKEALLQWAAERRGAAEKLQQSEGRQ